MSEKNSVYGSTTAQRILLCRKKMGLTRRQLREQLIKIRPYMELGKSTIQGWENGKKPRDIYIAALSELFGCSQEFLCCKSDDFISLKENHYTKININDLKYYNNEPVWIYCLNDNNCIDSDYALVNMEKECFVFSDCTTLAFSELTEKAKLYARNILSKDFQSDPISLEAAKVMDKVFIKEKNVISKNSSYSGWYKYNSETKCFEKEDQKIFLREDAFNISYIAYVDMPF